LYAKETIENESKIKNTLRKMEIPAFYSCLCGAQCLFTYFSFC